MLRVITSIFIVVLIIMNAWQYVDRQRLRNDFSRNVASLQSIKPVASLLRDQKAFDPLHEQSESNRTTVVSSNPSGTSPDTIKHPMAAFAEAIENPAIREVMAAQQRAALDVQYQRLYDYLDLDDDELAHFQSLITEAQMVITEKGLQLASGTLSPKKRELLAKNIASTKRNLDAQVEEFLNDDTDFDYYNFYNETLGERMAANGLRSMLEGDGHAMDIQTEEALVKLMHEERQDIGFENHYYDQNRFDPSTLTQAKIDRFMEQYDQLQSNLTESAGTVLGSQHLEAFQAIQETSRSMQEMGLGMMFQMFRQK